MSALLDDTFAEIGSSGRIYTKSDVVGDLATESPRVIEVSDLASEEVAPGVVLVNYRTGPQGSVALRSSIWIERTDGWKMVFHQGRGFPPTPATPPLRHFPQPARRAGGD